MKFKNYIETESGIKDTSTSPGTAGQVLSSTVTGTSWIDPDTLEAAASKLVVISCKNVSGAQILKGTPVYQSGTVGATDVIEVEPADATISTGYLPAIGILQTTLNNNGFGNVVITGEFLNYSTSDIPTDRPGGDPFTGDTVYLAVGGGLTCIKPTGAGNAIQNMGLIGKVSGGNSGSITVASIMRANDVPNLPEGRIWIGDGNTIVSDTVYVDEPNGRVGIGTTSPLGAIQIGDGAAASPSTNQIIVLSNIATTGGNSNLYLATGASGTSTIGMGSTQFSPTNTAGKIIYSDIVDTFSFNTNFSTKMVINGSGNVGIGTTNPNEKLEVNGSVRVTGAGLDVGYGNNSNNFVQIGNGRTTNGFAFIDLVGDTTYSDYGLRLVRNNGGANTNSEIIHRGTGALNLNVTQAGSITLKTSNVERVRVNSSGNVGIGTTNPRTKLHVSGLTGDDDPALGSSTAPFFVSNTATSYGLNIGVNNVGASWLQAQSNTSAIAYEMSLNPLGGNVGVGFINPSKKLDVNGSLGCTSFEMGNLKMLTAFGDIFINGTTSGNTIFYGAPASFTQNLQVQGTVTCVNLVQTSQTDKKKDISNIDKSKAKTIQFKEYKYKEGDGDRKRYGVLVEDLENDYPELVHVGADGVKGINYIDLLVKRVAELEKELEDISLTPGAQGPQGAQGAQGPAGSNGKDGSIGATGLQGPQGATGATGSAGSDGKNGSDGNSHLSNITSIGINEKSGQLEIVIGRSIYKFNPDK